MAEEKHKFSFDRNITDEGRKIRAIEHIAYYLDRIEGHLATIASRLGPEFEKDTKLITAVNQIAAAINRQPR